MSKPSSRVEARRQLLLDVLHALETCYPVHSRRMRSALTAGEFREYSEELDSTWPQPKGWEKTSFARFKKLIRAGDIYEGRARKLPCVGPLAMKRHLLMREAQRSYNAALERATELLQENPGLAHMFDREVTDGLGDEMEGVPRPKGSAHEFAKPVPASELRDRAALQRRHAQSSLGALSGRQLLASSSRALNRGYGQQIR